MQTAFARRPAGRARAQGAAGPGVGHPGRGAHVRPTPALPLTQWPEGRAQLGREELRLLTSKHWIERGAVERLIP